MSMKYKILFITDSLAYPRIEPESVLYDETYISLLKNEFTNCDFIHQGRGGATIIDLYKHSTYYHQTLRPDLVFMQSGVVDCAPRALTVIEQMVISRLPLFREPLTALVKKYSRFLRKARKMTYTSINMFVNNVERFEALFPNVYWIGILPATEEYECKLEGIRRNTEVYNDVLRRRKYVGTEHFDASMIMSDHHHLNRAGHRKMYEEIARVIRIELEGLETSSEGLRDDCAEVAAHISERFLYSR
jgi:lysophospholipase L1-like esterase